MAKPPHILVVDDDPQICQLVEDYLTKHGYQVTTAHDGHQMQKRLKEAVFDLLILDIMLPGEDGISLCRKLRAESAISIIFLSALGDEADRIVGLEVGADDYLIKPFSPRELLARVKALLRRSQGELGAERAKQAAVHMPDLKFEKWTLDQKRRCLISPEDITVPLSSGEYDLLLAFIEHPNRTLSRDQLLDLTSGKEAGPFDRSIDVQVGRLRKKIEVDPKSPKIILTMRGNGYQFVASVTTQE